jgi:hypothetical protein
VQESFDFLMQGADFLLPDMLAQPLQGLRTVPSLAILLFALGCGLLLLSRFVIRQSQSLGANIWRQILD